MPTTLRPRKTTTLLPTAAALAFALTGCGGNGDAASAMAGASGDRGVGSNDSVAEVDGGSHAGTSTRVEAQPTFHMLPAELAAPDPDADMHSATQPPRSIVVPEALRSLDTRRLTPQALDAAASRIRAQGRSVSTRGQAAPDATPMTAQVYTAAQIRQAYGLPALPVAGAQLNASEQAALGAGQTIYIVDAHDDPNIFAELTAFNTNLGLPACTRVAIAATTALPISQAGSACTFSKVVATGAGAMTATLPTYDAGWASEIALDVEWSHAMAPLARIVLVEAADASNSALTGAVKLANRMGPGVVSMSFGAGEGSWVPSMDAIFTASAMTYLASSGDNGAGTSWPAVSPNVLAIGGTSLTWTGSGTRSESAWSGSGGGISWTEALPSWQQGVAIAGGGTLSARAMADVSFNADPATGQYTAIIRPGQTAAQWYAYGGTSISSPQWAGLLAISNAQRLLAGKALLGDVHSMIYQDIAGDSSAYAAAFADITTGSDGSCGTCAAGTGFDQPTGWGTPNVAQLLPLLLAEGSVVPANHAPAMSGGTLDAVTGTAYHGQVSGTDVDGDTLTYTMMGAPSGLQISSAGALTWNAPVRGTYTLRVTARDPGGLQATGAWTLTVRMANVAPVVTPATVSGVAGKTLAVAMKATDANGDALTFSLTNPPSGMTIGPHGGVTWTSPTAGQTRVTVVARDPGGLSGSATLTLNIDSVPTLAGGTLVAAPGVAYSHTIQGSDSDNDRLTYTMTGAPLGLTLSSTGTLAWSRPVAGTYTLHVTVHDGRGGQSTTTITLAVHN